MTTASVVRYDASDAQDKADALEFGRLIRKLRHELEEVEALRDLTSSDHAGMLELNVMIRRALAQAAPQISIPANATEPITDDTWCSRCYNTGLVSDGEAFVNCTCLDEAVLPVTVVRLGARSLGECCPLSDFLQHIPSSDISEADRDALVALAQLEQPFSIHDERWAAARADGAIGIGASPIEALLALEQQHDRGSILESIAHRRDPMPEEHRTTVMEAVSKEIAQYALLAG